MFQHGFGLANAIGIAALVLAVLLAATSSDFAMRRLGVRLEVLADGRLPMWWLTVAHVAYFLFMHFLSFHRANATAEPLQPWFVGLVVLVLGLRAAGLPEDHPRQGRVRTAGRGGKSCVGLNANSRMRQGRRPGGPLLLGGAMSSVVSVLGFRMWQLGVRDAEQYYLLAEGEPDQPAAGTSRQGAHL